MEKHWKQIRNDYWEGNLLYVDGYETDDEMEEGKVLAILNTDDYSVQYVDTRAENSVEVNTLLKSLINNLIDEKENIVNTLITEIQADFNSGDFTVIDELLHSIARNKLIGWLSDENMQKYLH